MIYTDFVIVSVWEYMFMLMYLIELRGKGETKVK